jgi:hypothetical protein
MPLQWPEPKLPTSRPPPLAREAPTETDTATLPLRLTEPETRPPPAEKTRPPATVKGTLYPELQAPRVVAKTVVQTPS